jgi:transposase
MDDNAAGSLEVGTAGGRAMALGRRSESRQEELFVPHDRLPRSEGHAFYQQLNRLLAEAGFDRYVERLCGPHYQPSGTPGRPSIPPGVYFRMLLVGYFEGIGSQRGIAWRCHDSLSLREFLGVPLTEDAPDHSSLTRVRDRLPLEVHAAVFEFVLKLADKKGLVKGKTVGIDSTTLEASAAMKSIVRKETGEDWRQYVVGLMQEQGVIATNEEPTDEEVRRFDKQRKNKKVSNEDWESTTDPDARIAKLKDGRTHLAYKAEHVVDLASELIVAAEVYHADQSDSYTLLDSVMEAQGHLREATGETPIAEVAADKGYHAAEPLELAGTLGLRTYIPEPERQHKRRWTDKRPKLKAAVYANRRRTKTDKGKRLQRLRSERVERSFAHVCETGGARRTWLCGIEKVRKRLLLSAGAHNLGVLMRALFGMGTPRGLQKEGGDDDGLAALLRLAWLIVPSFRTALAAFARFTNNLHQHKTHHAADALAA